MMFDDDLKTYHSERALAELDLAERATCPDAARAHYRLSSLHQEQSQKLDGGSGSAAASQQA
jgi:hypothetical protein